MQLLDAELDGKKIAFHEGTEFLVQVGKDKGTYKTRGAYFGRDLARAVFHYRRLNISNGYKKRLLAPSFNVPVLARYISH